MSENQIEQLKDWYTKSRPLYKGLTSIVHSTVESLIKNAKIDYLSVTSRTKAMDSLLEKAKRKQYEDPEKELTDLSGIRVTTFIESDVDRVCDTVKSSFNVHPDKSLDKTTELGIDRFGYRSVHFICDLGSDRIKLPEFSLYKDLLFEVQVRTVLQHAWAEIEHDRNYKFSGILPTHIRRRLYLLSGVLEIVDREFVTLANEIDRYAEEVSSKTHSGDLDVEVNSTSLSLYLPEKLRKIENLKAKPPKGSGKFEGVIAELRGFNINTLADLDNLLNEEFFTSWSKHFTSKSYVSYVGLLRDAMMFADIDRYFSDSWNQRWKGTEQSGFRFLVDKYGRKKVEEIFNEYDIDILPLD